MAPAEARRLSTSAMWAPQSAYKCWCCFIIYSAVRCSLTMRCCSGGRLLMCERKGMRMRPGLAGGGDGGGRRRGHACKCKREIICMRPGLAGGGDGGGRRRGRECDDAAHHDVHDLRPVGAVAGGALQDLRRVRRRIRSRGGLCRCVDAGPIFLASACSPPCTGGSPILSACRRGWVKTRSQEQRASAAFAHAAPANLPWSLQIEDG